MDDTVETVRETSTGGTDLVKSSVTLTLPSGAVARITARHGLSSRLTAGGVALGATALGEGRVAPEARRGSCAVEVDAGAADPIVAAAGDIGCDPNVAAFNGHLSNGPLYSSTGFYGQPTGSKPGSGSASYFFVDVIFEEYVPLPNLYVGGIYLGGTDYWGNEIVTIHICNNGDGAAGPSTTRMKYWYANGGPWQFRWDRTYATSGIAAGSCTALLVAGQSAIGSNLYEVWADALDQVYESNEGDNYAYTIWNRAF